MVATEELELLQCWYHTVVVVQESVIYRLNALEDKVSGTELDLILARNKGRATSRPSVLTD
jgi:hypothetical protein